MFSYLRKPVTGAIAALTGRCLVAYLFIGAASWHLRSAGWSVTLLDMQKHGVPAPGLFLVAAMSISSASSLALLVNWHAKWAAYTLAGYTLLVSSVLHNPLQAVGADYFLFVKDLGIAGALLALAAVMPRESAAPLSSP